MVPEGGRDVSASSAPGIRTPAASRAPAWGFVVVVSLLTLVTLITLVAGNGNLALALAPALIFGVLCAIWKLPLRYPALALIFLALTLENPSDVPACGLWRSPLYTVGALLLTHLNVTIPLRPLIFSGLDLVLGYLIFVTFCRHMLRPARDRAVAPGARPMRTLALACLAGAFWMWTYGMARGGADFGSSLWQVQRVIYLPIIFLLFRHAFRGPRDHEAIGKVLVFAACARALLAIYIRQTVPPPPGEPALLYATTHTDSMLFAGAACILVALLVEHHDRKRTLFALLALPLVIAGAIANNRRLVWVELGVALLVLFFASRWTPVKRKIAQGVIVTMPVIFIYAGVGWESSASLFRPVQIARSVIDSKADASTEWRDWENYNLFYTFKESPVLGTGYGHGYVEIVKLPDISSSYSLYRYIPHNSILGLWAYGGLVGFTAEWLTLVAALFLAARAYRFAHEPLDRVAALSVIGIVVTYLVHCYGDMGLGTWAAVFTVGPALVVASQLAVATGAWPAAARRTSAPPPPVDLPDFIEDPELERKPALPRLPQG
jgi:O-antigen ligase